MSADGINKAILELESRPTTEDTVQKLASLYIIRDQLQSGIPPVVKDVETELDDILPCYKDYKKVKRRYQLHEVPKEAVQESLKDVCKEIDEFIHTLFNNTDMPEERKQIKQLITNLQSIKAP